MKYKLDFPQETFLEADRLVRSVILADGAVRNWNSLRVVTSDVKDVPNKHRARIQNDLTNTKKILHAITLVCPHNSYEFDLWINPVVVDPNSGNFRATILHELCHGYLGVGVGHQDTWRRLYARTLYHYHTQVHAIEHYGSLVTLSNWSYTKRVKSETTNQFLKRIDGDKDKWLKQADDESAEVASIFKRIK